MCFVFYMDFVREEIKKADNLEFLKELSLLLCSSVEELQKDLKKTREEIKKREREEAKKKQLWLGDLKHKIHVLKRRLFRRGRETVKEKDTERNSEEAKQLELIPRERLEEEEKLLLHAQSLAKAPKTSKNKIPEEEKVYEASKEVLIKKAKEKGLQGDLCIEEMESFESSIEVTVTEKTYKKILHKRKKYKVKESDGQKALIFTAPGPEKLFPRCKYSIDFALQVVEEKFLNHKPYERQRRHLKKAGLDVPVRTLYRLSEMVALHLEKVAEDIREDIFEAPLACHIDETPWPILGSDDSGYMWVLSNQAGSYYRFEPTRSGEIAKELLKGYRGSVIVDKYAGYNRLKQKNTLGYCWAHARRRFLDLMESYPKEAQEILEVINSLFAIERRAQTWDELRQLRKTESKACLEDLKELLLKYQSEFFDRDEFCKATSYLLSDWEHFTAFVEDITLPLSNNDAERALRHSVLGRKNFYGSKSIDGADIASTLYTIIESCKKVEIDPVSYMKYVIKENHHSRDPLTPLKYAKRTRNLH
ncbi:MAG: IS66 family transposase [Bdellovibrio sp.]|nr:MAG: IS66 family transposase [Bdellovibrio sp.]